MTRTRTHHLYDLFYRDLRRAEYDHTWAPKSTYMPNIWNKTCSFVFYFLKFCIRSAYYVKVSYSLMIHNHRCQFPNLRVQQPFPIQITDLFYNWILLLSGLIIILMLYGKETLSCHLLRAIPVYYICPKNLFKITGPAQNAYELISAHWKVVANELKRGSILIL